MSLMSVFIDDIFIYFRNDEEHATHFRVVLQNLKERLLFTKLSKCEFLFHSIISLVTLYLAKGSE